MTTNDIDAIEACIKNGAYHEMDLRALCAEVRELRAALERALSDAEYWKREWAKDEMEIGSDTHAIQARAERDKAEAALERARALASQMQKYAEGMDEELNSSGVVVVATIRAFGDKLAAALAEGGRP